MKWWLAAVVLLAACGRAGAPVPPERVTPVPASHLSAIVEDRAVVLSFTAPTRRADNARLRDLTMLRVFRAEDDGTGELKPAMKDGRRVVGYTEIAAIVPATPAPATVEDNRVTLVDQTALTVGRRYAYVVLAEDGRGHALRRRAHVTALMVAAPAAPGDLQATAGDREVRLAWRPSRTLADGSTAGRALVYEILRAPAADAPLEIVTVTAPGAAAFVDRGLDNERPYLYALRALLTSRGTLARSGLTPRVAATPVDMTPPRPPTELVAIPSAGTVRLVWIGSPDPDVGRYIVYRGRDGASLERIGSLASPGITFTDRDVPAGRWRYAVSAQDTSSRANESVRSAEVTVTVP